MPRGLPIVQVGAKARAAVEASGGVVRVLAALSESLYLLAGEEIVWLGGRDATLHPRALLTATRTVPVALAPSRLFQRPRSVRLDLAGARVWAPAPPPRGPAAVDAVRRGARALRAQLPTLGEPQSFAAFLLGRPLPALLAPAAASAAALLRACADDDAAGAATAARKLLGLGPGLTPAGDDVVGGAFFARAVLRALGDDGGAPEHEAWARAAAAVVAAARIATHAISATLLADLCAGDAYAPLHELAGALAADAPLAHAAEAARRLVRLGHASGWDLLAGFLGALTGPPDG